ncbi:MAG: hypothetical protein ACYC8T_24490 [Myxococcaceae bacterium]
MATHLKLCWVGMAAALAACTADPGKPVSATNHPWFPVGAGAVHEVRKAIVDGQLSCDGCHRPAADSFKAVRCDHCHKHTEAITRRLHLGMPSSFVVDTSAVFDPELKAELRGANCYGCHPTGERRPFSHAQITGECSECHAPGNAFAALPRPDFTHREVGASDCGGCHVTRSWSETNGAPPGSFDPSRDVVVDALQPTWLGTSIISVAADRQVLHMTMNHAALSVSAGVLEVCSNCHAQADQDQYYPGVMHWSLTTLGVAQPTTCDECHGSSGPKSFSGDPDPRRTPVTGEMRHDAVVWAGDAPTTTRIVTAGCNVCHQAPDELIDAKWKFAFGKQDAGATLHGPLTDANLPQPQACLDCHANSRPVAPVVSAGLSFDHSTALGECKDCHASTSQWSGGRYHTAAAPALTSCLPCHESGRPTSTAGWTGSFTASPFDYVTNANGEGHGADADCVVCHSGPGTGTWGTSHNWQGGQFAHSGTGLDATTCISCHTTQRPDLLSPPADAGYDHAVNGTGDCLGCHQATVSRGAYVRLLPIPGGDWRGGQTYPGATLISTPGQSVRVQSTALTRTGTRVTGMTTTTVTLPNAFLHTSAAIPAAIFPGPAAAPDNSTCWHCHTSTGTTVTSFSNGWFHRALTEFRATPAAGITPLSQPSACNDCHRTMRPPNIVSKTDGGTWLLPMDHGAAFTGGSVPTVAAMDCGACHNTPGLGPTRWSDGNYHSNLPSGAQPSECVSCHYPLVTTAKADVTVPDAGLPSTFTMKHRSTLVTLQACATCHAGALARSTTSPAAATLWKVGAYHASLTATTQPAACLDCHAASDPTGATQGTVVYALAQGGTPTNGGQWTNHTDAAVTGKDCATCHLADAKVSSSAWSRGTAFHAKVSNVTACAKCHGLTNGRGTVVGTNNNMPAGLNDTVTLTTSTAAAANTHDQIAHTDSNVTRFDCNVCHTQVGPSTAAGVQGKEWAKAAFHKNFTAARPLVLNGTTGRCSNCHLNVKPGTAYTKHNHSAYTGTSTQDCSSCHSFPGTSSTTPNWLGASGGHATTGSTAASALDCNTCHGQAGSAQKRLTVSAASHRGGISNGNRCTSCHVNFAGFKDTVANLKYSHTNATANVGGCVTCHPFAGGLYTTLTNTPALTRPTAPGGHQFSQSLSVTGSFDGDSFTSNHSNSGLTRCGSCHQYAATTASTNVWTFKHRPSNPGISNSKSTSGCSMCH